VGAGFGYVIIIFMVCGFRGVKSRASPIKACVMVSKQFAAHKDFANDTANHLYTYVTSSSPLETGVRLPTRMRINHLQHVSLAAMPNP